MVSVPPADVGVEGTVAEHMVHVADRRCVPAADLGVERRLVIEQIAHAGDRGHVPAADVAVFRRGGRGARRPVRHGELDVAVGDGRELGDDDG